MNTFNFYFYFLLIILTTCLYSQTAHSVDHSSINHLNNIKHIQNLQSYYFDDYLSRDPNYSFKSNISYLEPNNNNLNFKDYSFFNFAMSSALVIPFIPFLSAISNNFAIKLSIASVGSFYLLHRFFNHRFKNLYINSNEELYSSLENPANFHHTNSVQSSNNNTNPQTNPYNKRTFTSTSTNSNQQNPQPDKNLVPLFTTQNSQDPSNYNLSNPSTNHIIVHDNIIHKPSLLEASITNTLIDKLAQKYHIADIDYLYFRKLLENFIEKQVTSPNDRYILITDIMGYRFQSDPQLKRTLNLHPDQFKSQRNKLKALWNLQLITAHRDYDHLSQLFADQISIILDLDHIINTSTADNLSFQGSTSQFFANNPRIFKAVYNFVNTLKNPEQKAMFLCIVFSIPKMSVEDISQVFNKNINYILNFVDLQVDRLINLHNLHDYKEFHLYKDLYINYYEVNNLTDENSSIEGSKNFSLAVMPNYLINKLNNHQSTIKKLISQLNKLSYQEFSIIAHRFNVGYNHVKPFKNYVLNYINLLENDLDKMIFILLVLDQNNLSFINDIYQSFDDQHHNVIEISNKSKKTINQIYQIYLDLHFDFSMFISGKAENTPNITLTQDSLPFKSKLELLRTSMSVVYHGNFDYSEFFNIIEDQRIIDDFFKKDSFTKNHLVYNFILKKLTNHLHRLIFLNQVLKIYYLDPSIFNILIEKDLSEHQLSDTKETLTLKFKSFIKKQIN